LTCSFWKDKSVLITGVCGTVGREILRQLIDEKPTEIIGLDNNESELFFLNEEYLPHDNVKLFFGDIRDPDKLMRKSRRVNYILHTAALKHVILCEHSPRDPVQTNIIGTQNVIDAALTNGVERVVFTSSDKAVNPTNVMGTTKLMGERLMTAANAHRRNGGPIFSSTRFGNVLGSRGSVIPIFKRQIAAGGPVTLTTPEMTRFIMTLANAVRLVMDSAPLVKGGEVFVTKMPIACIADLAQVMIEELAPHYGYNPEQIKIKVIGSKPGEKVYEELMNTEETRRTVELKDFFVVKPAFTCVYENVDYTYENILRVGIDNPYNSSVEKPMSREELRIFLLKNDLLNEGE
jgi:FlaA1/EpsC-like NDP-sugar epimerase